MIGSLFKCMVHNNKKRIYMSLDEYPEAIQIKNQLTIGSQFQHESKLDDAKILHMNAIMNDWLYLRFTRYTHLYENISSVT